MCLRGAHNIKSRQDTLSENSVICNKRFFSLKAEDLCLIPVFTSLVYMETGMTKGSLLDMLKGCKKDHDTVTLHVNICFLLCSTRPLLRTVVNTIQMGALISNDTQFWWQQLRRVFYKRINVITYWRKCPIFASFSPSIWFNLRMGMLLVLCIWIWGLDRKKKTQEKHRFASNPTDPVWVAWGWSLSQLTSGERLDTYWTGCQFITGLTYRDKQAHTFRPTPTYCNLESPVNQRICLWAVGRSQGTERESAQTCKPHTGGPDWEWSPISFYSSCVLGFKQFFIDKPNQRRGTPIQTLTAPFSLSLPLLLSYAPFSQPVIQRSVVQATALATVPPRAQCCQVRMKVPGGGDANHPLHPTREPHKNPGYKPAPGFFSQQWCNASVGY